VAFCHNDDDEGAVGVEAAVRAQGPRAFSWRCDLSDMGAARRLFADAEKKSLLPRSCWPLQTAVSMPGRRCTRTAPTSCPDRAHGKGLWSGSSDRGSIACTPLLPSTV
jgi:hypothetical protein